jgi:hypothetical protein
LQAHAGPVNIAIRTLAHHRDPQRRALSAEWNKGDDISVARRLVSVEASDTIASQYVGVPISTIVIDKKGARWIDKGACTWEPEPRK